eukprot:354633-Chlamydomonas_euryale.AAC.22
MHESQLVGRLCCESIREYACERLYCKSMQDYQRRHDGRLPDLRPHIRMAVERRHLDALVKQALNYRFAHCDYAHGLQPAVYATTTWSHMASFAVPSWRQLRG